MSILSTGLGFVRQWFPDVAGPREDAPRHPLSVELNGTVGIARAEGDRIEATIAGQIQTSEPHRLLSATSDEIEMDSVPALYQAVEARCHSTGRLAESDPFVWIQLFDDRGASLTHQTFLGRGVGVEYKVHARIEVPAVVAPRSVAAAGEDARAPRRRLPRLASGLHARIVTRTYGHSSGPRYHMEELGLRLLNAGTALPIPATAVA